MIDPQAKLGPTCSRCWNSGAIRGSDENPRRKKGRSPRNTWDRLEVSFWFAPAIMSVGAVLLAWVMFWLDSQIPNAPSRTAASSCPAR